MRWCRSRLPCLGGPLAASVDNENYTLDLSSSCGPLKTKEPIRTQYIRSLPKVIDESDIIILVLDARDPEGCRSRLVEEEVRRRESEGKRRRAKESVLENAVQERAS